MSRRELHQVMYGASASDADMLYATGIFVPDAFLFVRKQGRRFALFRDLEIDRARREADVEQIDSWTSVENDLQKKPGTRPESFHVIAAYLKGLGIRRAEVPAHFPAALFRQLESVGISLEPVQRELFDPTREIKDARSLRKINAALRATEAGLERAFEILRTATIRRDRSLSWGGKVLTSERLRIEMEISVLRSGGRAHDTIVAGGIQACDPHERGSGPLKAGELIILDLFPRMPTGFYGDLTRTVVKGRATDSQRKLWQTVLDAQRQAIKAIHPGAEGAAVHHGVVRFFEKSGYFTRVVHGRQTGFFHGTGHGLGLDLHEPPRLGATRFRAGQVFTVEPGLYYPEIGGVRHEDVIVVTPKGCRCLSRLDKPFEL